MERKGPTLPLPDGSQMPTTEIGFRSSGEHWNEYLADDGTVIKIKLVVTDVYRVDGRYDGDGNPLYLTKSTNIMAISAPEDLKENKR